MNTAVINARISPDLLRKVWRYDTRKRLANAVGIAARTAKDWLVDGAPLSRRLELANAIEQELARIEREAQELRAARDLLRETDARTDTPANVMGASAPMALARKIASWGRS